jgi:hypothetical protein
VPTLKKTKTRGFPINNIMLHINLLGKQEQEQTKPKTNRWREKTKNRIEINEIKTKINYTKNQ